MKRITGLTILTALLALWTIAVFGLIPSVALGAVPQLINFQGILKDGSGNPVANGSYSVVFAIYHAPTGSMVFWSETQSVTTTNGLFNTLLGSVVPIPESLFVDSSLYLGIKVGADPEMTPRQKISSVGYSYTSAQWSSTAVGHLFRLNGNVGIGTSSPAAKLDVGGTLLVNPSFSFVGVNRSTQVSGAEYFGIAAPVLSGMYGGMYISTPGVDGWPFYGYSTLNHTAWTYLDGQTGDWKLYNNGFFLRVGSAGDAAIGNGDALQVSSSGNVSIATLPFLSNYRFSVLDDGSAASRAVFGWSTGIGGIGVGGRADNSGGTGIYGYSLSGGSYAGYFDGPVHVNGTLSKSAGSFKIDHPLDPANKYLYHSFVESPDMKNIYDGTVTLDPRGEATVQLPDWFGALNKDFRYQLTAIGAPGPNLYIAQEISGNQFKIAGGSPGMKVSWQVTGIRQDAYANAHRIPVEEEKPAAERGKYLHPKELGMPDALGMHYEEMQKMEAEHKKMEEQQAKMEQERVIQEQKIKEHK